MRIDIFIYWAFPILQDPIHILVLLDNYHNPEKDHSVQNQGLANKMLHSDKDTPYFTNYMLLQWVGRSSKLGAFVLK